MDFMKIILIFSLILPPTFAQDLNKGEVLHRDNCIACHAAMTGGDGSVLYTRNDRRVTSLELLSKQVNRCQSSLGLGWTAKDIENVQHFLNVNYYHY